MVSAVPSLAEGAVWLLLTCNSPFCSRAGDTNSVLVTEAQCKKVVQITKALDDEQGEMGSRPRAWCIGPDGEMTDSFEAEAIPLKKSKRGKK